jgi:2-methylcitrate dehydratase PrpD
VIDEDAASARRTFMKQMAAAGAALAATETRAETSPAAAGEGAPGRPQPAARETVQLAAYAAGLRYEDLPSDVVQRAKDTIAETVAIMTYGALLPWSRMVIAYAQHNSGAGKSWILGAPGSPVHAGAAALANGALAHAFELDNLTHPNSGVHPGATAFAAALAVAQEHGCDGRELVTAFVAGAELMIRVGRATHHSNEARGFHAPGTTGPFGAAAAAGRLMRLDADKMTNALGIAGSLAGGLLEFARSGTGAMVKRLHLGRAAESGVLAASLAAEGFTGPASVLEGEYGFLRVFCNEHDVSELTRGLGETYLTRSILMKRFACHITAHTPVEAILDLREELKFAAADVAAIGIVGNKRIATVNNIPRPADVMLAQYSVPFAVALALYRDPRDPRSFDEQAVHDRDILETAGRIAITADPKPRVHGDLASTVTVTLKDGRTGSRTVSEFKGTPARPLDQAELEEKFLVLTRHLDAERMRGIFARLQRIEAEKSLDWLNL